MANFRMKVGLNRGKGPVDFKSLSSLTDEINSFLRKLGEDAGLVASANKWFATNVEDGSLLTDAEPGLEVSPETAARLEEMVAAIVRGDAVGSQGLGVREQTKLQFAVVARKASNIHVPVDFGLYGSTRSKQVVWHSVNEDQASRLTLYVSPTVDFMGGIQGVIHAWFKESGEPHFQLRELGHNALINCYYRPEHYNDILRAVARREERVHVAGLIRASRIDKTIESVKVSKIKNPVDFTDADFERFFGCAPSMTGDRDSAEFVEWNRRHDA